MAKWRRFLISLALSAVPVRGVFEEDWSDGSGMALYWCESVMVIVLVTIRIALHRTLTAKQGHDYPAFNRQLDVGAKRVPRERRRGRFLSDFLTAAVSGTAVHGIFLAALLLLLIPDESRGAAAIDPASLGQGCLQTAGILLAGFCWDLLGIGKRSFAWLRENVDATMNRLGVVHFAILLGMVGLAWSHQPRALFLTFAGVRTALDFLALIPAPDGPEAPRWMAALINRFGGRKIGFDAYWRDDYSDQQARKQEDERMGPEKSKEHRASPRALAPPARR